MTINKNNSVSEEVLRKHRAMLAEKLLPKESTLTTTVSWVDLDKLPFWCALADTEIQQLVTQCGVMLYWQAMQQTIDGLLLKNFLALAHSKDYSCIDSQPDAHRLVNLPTPQADTIQNYVNTAGVALLLCTVGNNPCFAAVASRLPCAPMFNFDLSQKHALDLLMLLEEQPTTSKLQPAEVAA